ncbi:MAG: hypothetical protein H7Y32_08320, partial [Chloroflexales bacterium]|nr:hypothetical protein [Chloroflexales bacterium]
MRARALFALLIAAVCVLPNAPTRAAIAPGPATVYTLPDLDLATVQNAALPGSLADDRGFLLGGIGSDLWRSPADPANEYWVVTDRGPNAELPFFTG